MCTRFGVLNGQRNQRDEVKVMLFDFHPSIQ